jgi:hypothetical protein
MEFISAQQRKDFEEAWASASKDPAAFCLLPPVFDLVAVKE